MSFPKFWERDDKMQENVSLCESGVLAAVFQFYERKAQPMHLIIILY